MARRLNPSLRCLSCSSNALSGTAERTSRPDFSEASPPYEIVAGFKESGCIETTWTGTFRRRVFERLEARADDRIHTTP